MRAIDGHDRDAPIFAPDAFRLGDEEAALIDKARRFGARVLAPRAAQHDRDATFPIENFRDMHPQGLLRICVPKEHGGLGASFRTYCLAAAELGRYCGATALSWNMHVCSTLWTGALADDLMMTVEERAEHNERRQLHYKRIVGDGAIYSQPFSEGGAAAAGTIAFGTEAKPVDGGFLVRDPWRTAVVFVSTAATGLSSRAVVATVDASTATTAPTNRILRTRSQYRRQTGDSSASEGQLSPAPPSNDHLDPAAGRQPRCDRPRRSRFRRGIDRQAGHHRAADLERLVRERHQLHRTGSAGDLDLRRLAPTLRLSA